MGIWFLENTERLMFEKEEFEKLKNKSDWLTGVNWSLSNGLTAIIEINAHNQEYKVELIYPTLYPNVPAIVKPIDDNRWSEHQYIHGELCLEWGPDNWVSSITGAQLIESTYRLIEADRPKDIREDSRSILPSRHHLSIGQKTRGNILRLYIDNQILNKILQNREHLNLKYNVEVNGKTAIFHLLEAANNESDLVWQNSNYHLSNNENTDNYGHIFFLNDLEKHTKPLKTLKDLTDLLSSINEYNDFKLEDINKEGNKLFILADKLIMKAYIVFASDQKLQELSMIVEKEFVDRRPDSYSELEEKRIGIVGVGSLGSKVINNLARMGIMKFLLIDEDIFLSNNIQRHTLDWLSVGSHKVDAIKEQVQKLSVFIEVDVSRINLTGQESATALDGTLSDLGKCDIIIDATADSKVFNILSAVSEKYKKDLFWGEIFAGGIGGMIARSRWSIDVDPQTMRRILIEYSNKNPATEFDVATTYDIEDADGEVLLATDADVGVIANHLSRFIMDTLINKTNSNYPYSLYLIGLSKGWVFSQPFETIPIETDIEMQSERESDVSEEAKEFILSLLESH